MDSNIVLILALILVFCLVIFQAVESQKAKFEDNEHHRELLEQFIEGFRSGLHNEQVNSARFVDDILRRVGFTAPEMTVPGGITEVTEPRLDESEPIPPVVLDAEVDFDLEELQRQGQAEVNTAQWGEGNLPSGLPTNTPQLYDQENPHT